MTGIPETTTRPSETRRGKFAPHAAGLAIVAAALAIRAAYILTVRHNPQFEPILPGYDMTIFHEWAKRIAGGELTEHKAFYQAPLYPYLLAVIYRVCGPSVLAATLFQAFMGSLSVGLVYLLGRRLFGQGAGLWAAGLAALTPIFPYYEGFLLRDSLATFTVLLFLWSLYSFSPERPYRTAALAGLCLGLAALTRANVLILLPLGAARVWLESRSAGRRKCLAAAAVLTAATFVTLSPATLHNRLAGGQWALVETNFSANWRIGNSRDSNGGYCEPKGDPLPIFSSDYLRLQGRKLKMLLSDYEEPNNMNFYHFRRYSLWLRQPLFSWGFFLAFGLAGIIVTRRQWRQLYPLYGYLILYGVTLVAFFVTSRFRMPLWPGLILFSGALFERAVEFFRRRQIAGALASLGLPALAALGFVSLNPRTIQAQYFESAAAVCETRGAVENEIRELTDCLVLYPDTRKYYMQLADCYYNSGRKPEALEVTRRLISRRPEFAPGWYGAGRLAYELGQRQEAAADLGRYLELNPTAPDSAEIRKFLRQQAQSALPDSLHPGGGNP